MKSLTLKDGTPWYIGDISKNDALVLKEMAERYGRILEFGMGASTQVLLKYAREESVVSVDTDEHWITKTFENVGLLVPDRTLASCNYQNFINTLGDDKYDFIFDDGVDSLRREFAIKIWPHLSVGGVLAFHDTRRAHDFRNVLEVLAHFMDEIEKVEFNYKESNITLIYKKSPQPYSNWQIDENKQPWELGYGELPQEFIDKIKAEQNGTN